MEAGHLSYPFREDGLDQGYQRIPGDHRFHLNQELLALVLQLGGRLLVFCEAELLAVHQFSPCQCLHAHSRVDRPGFPQSP
jgi:hypothetical protein